jgi:diaminopimelate epimerase
MRTYERGVERETLSCATGAVSTAYTAKETQRIMRGIEEVTVKTLSGELRIKEKIDGYYIIGTAKRVFEADIHLDQLRL